MTDADRQKLCEAIRELAALGLGAAAIARRFRVSRRTVRRALADAPTSGPTVHVP